MENYQNEDNTISVITDPMDQIIPLKHLDTKNLSNLAMKRLVEELFLLGSNLEQEQCFFRRFDITKLGFKNSDKTKEFEGFQFYFQDIYEVIKFNESTSIEQDINQQGYLLSNDIQTNPFCLIYFDENEYKLCIYQVITLIIKQLDKTKLQEQQIWDEKKNLLQQYLPKECQQKYREMAKKEPPQKYKFKIPPKILNIGFTTFYITFTDNCYELDNEEQDGTIPGTQSFSFYDQIQFQEGPYEQNN